MVENRPAFVGVAGALEALEQVGLRRFFRVWSDVLRGVPCALETFLVFFDDVFTDNCGPCRQVLHDIPRRGRADSIAGCRS